jgi:very-short-patch-repair endonuclease
MAAAAVAVAEMVVVVGLADIIPEDRDNNLEWIKGGHRTVLLVYLEFWFAILGIVVRNFPPPHEEGLGEVIVTFNIMQVRGPKSGFRQTMQFRKDLRNNLTPAERRFWYYIGNKRFNNLKFRKQHGIGPYIVDFYCPEKKLIIEIDGDSHARSKVIYYDQERTLYLDKLGYKVVRYTNTDIMTNIEGVFQDLTRQLSLL